MNKFEKEYMRGGKDMSDILYSLFREISKEIRIDGGEYFKELVPGTTWLYQSRPK